MKATCRCDVPCRAEHEHGRLTIAQGNGRLSSVYYSEQLITMDYKEKLEEAKRLYETATPDQKYVLESLFPELKESEDEKIRKTLIEYFNAYPKDYFGGLKKSCLLAWLEKQGSEPNWCYHKVNLSNCSEEYRKAYYDGWNNCNMQHSQCKSEGNDVVKCLINGMKFYYEGNEEATWGTEKFSMKVKDILSWLEKQSEPLSVDVDVESMVQSYKKRLANECNISAESLLVTICLTSFRHGIENTIDDLKLKYLKTRQD